MCIVIFGFILGLQLRAVLCTRFQLLQERCSVSVGLFPAVALRYEARALGCAATVADRLRHTAGNFLIPQ
jgi:hypothetical protein